jgi:hypothetical protein
LDPKRPLLDFNMFVLVIIAHGQQGDIIESADKKKSVNVSEIIQKMDAMEDMRGRPKVLIVESIEGENYSNECEVKAK